MREDERVNGEVEKGRGCWATVVKKGGRAAGWQSGRVWFPQALSMKRKWLDHCDFEDGFLVFGFGPFGFGLLLPACCPCFLFLRQILCPIFAYQVLFGL